MSAKTIEAHSLHAEPLTIELELPVTEAAFARVSPRLLAMDPATVRDARLDLTVAAAVALAGAENVLSRRAALAQSFRDVPWSVLEGIEDLAHAAQHADLLHRAAQDTTVNFADILPRANELRGMLLLDLAAQVRRKRAPERTRAQQAARPRAQRAHGGAELVLRTGYEDVRRLEPLLLLRVHLDSVVVREACDAVAGEEDGGTRADVDRRQLASRAVDRAQRERAP
jgi:hypothetical protein